MLSNHHLNWQLLLNLNRVSLPPFYRYSPFFFYSFLYVLAIFMNCLILHSFTCWSGFYHVSIDTYNLARIYSCFSRILDHKFILLVECWKWAWMQIATIPILPKIKRDKNGVADTWCTTKASTNCKYKHKDSRGIPVSFTTSD